jgi:hypothetical protein
MALKDARAAPIGCQAEATDIKGEKAIKASWISSVRLSVSIRYYRFS